MKGIVLAGGTGSRLWPITRSVSKQLLPVYNKPMIYYPISTLMLAGINEILVITTQQDQLQFQELLGDGSKLGVSFKYATQPEPKGLAQALIIGEDFLDGDSCLMVLGDNIFYGTGLGGDLKNSIPKSGCHIFTFEVQNPDQYGVLSLDKSGKPLSVIEKPVYPDSNLAITGLYFFDSQAPKLAKTLEFSKRGELEITSLINTYLKKKTLTMTKLPRGTIWLDTGSFQSLHDAGTYVRLIEERSGQRIAQLEEIAWKNNWISNDELISLAENNSSEIVSNYLKQLMVKEYL